MNYNIKGTEVGITPELRDYVEKKLASLDKFLTDQEGARADVELEFARLVDGPKYRAELAVLDPGQKDMRAEARGTTLHEAIDVAAGDLFVELSRNKKKRLHVFRHSAVKVKEFLRGWRNKI